MADVRVENLSKSYGKQKVLKNVDLFLKAGSECAIRGSSGSGKSTLLHHLGGLEKPDQGSVALDGENLASLNDERLAKLRNGKIGLVFQFHFLLPALTGIQNILLPAEIGEVPIENIMSHVKYCARELDVLDCFEKYPNEMSGGQQQRVNIVRALSLSPKLVLCDEPTGNLDSKNSQKVVFLLKGLSKTFGATLVVVTHDDLVARHFSRQITIEDGVLIE